MIQKLIQVIIMVLVTHSVSAKNWFPLNVDVWDPPFNSDLRRSTQSYQPLNKAKKPWKICVSIPHLKDAYWLAVNYALIDEAKRLGIRMRIDEAGGYDKLSVQKRQIESCMKTGADGLIVSGISYDGLNALTTLYQTKGIPVIDLINWIDDSTISARSAVTYWDNAYQIGKYLSDYLKGKSAKVIWMPGPQGAGWSTAGDEGFKQAVKDSPIQILETIWGDTGREVQGQLLKEAFNRYDEVDFVVGTTVSAEAAVDLLTHRQALDEIKVLSYYYGPGVHRSLARGKMLAAPSDKQAIQARIAVDMVVRALEDKLILKHVGPKLEVVDKSNIRQFDASTSIPPKGFRPVFSHEDWVNH